MPPLGPLDDPPGVVYLDGKLTEKTVDVRVLNSVGEGAQAARKELFDLGSRRRSLVEERRAQTRRVREYSFFSRIMMLLNNLTECTEYNTYCKVTHSLG